MASLAKGLLSFKVIVQNANDVQLAALTGQVSSSLPAVLEGMRAVNSSIVRCFGPDADTYPEHVAYFKKLVVGSEPEVPSGIKTICDSIVTNYKTIVDDAIKTYTDSELLGKLAGDLDGNTQWDESRAKMFEPYYSSEDSINLYKQMKPIDLVKNIPTEFQAEMLTVTIRHPDIHKSVVATCSFLIEQIAGIDAAALPVRECFANLAVTQALFRSLKPGEARSAIISKVRKGLKKKKDLTANKCLMEFVEAKFSE